MRIRQHIVTGSARCTNSGVNGRRYITVHETANPAASADAAAHARLLAGGDYRAASWHWTVDDTEAVQSYEHTARTWNAGDGTGPGNNDSIAVEICVNAGGDYTQAVENAATLVNRIMRTEGIPIDRVVQHNRWTGKNCPTGIRAGRHMDWARFLDRVQNPSITTTPQEDKIMTRLTPAEWQGIVGRLDEIRATQTDIIERLDRAQTTADDTWKKATAAEVALDRIADKKH